VLGGPFEEIGVAVARHWGMPDAVRLGMRAAGAPGEDRASALTAFAHALTGAVYREDPAHAASETEAVVTGLGARAGLTRAQCRAVAERAVADTRELFAATGVRLDDLRLARQVACALADAPTEAAVRGGAARVAAGRRRRGSADAEAADAGAAPDAPLAATPPTGTLAVAAETARRSRRCARTWPPSSRRPRPTPAAFDTSRLILMTLEAVLRGGPFDRACPSRRRPGRRRVPPALALGEATTHLLAGPGIPFGRRRGPEWPGAAGWHRGPPGARDAADARPSRAPAAGGTRRASSCCRCASAGR
jgi:hypothetical protein